MKAACRCGACEIHLLHLEEPSQTYTADCHCVSCRTYHAAAFCSFLRRKDIHIEDDNNVASFSDVCGKLGPVQRLYCRKCFAKLATRTEGDEYYYVNMGSLVDELIRADYSAEWRQARHVWQADEPWKMAPWYPAHPDYLPPQRFPSFLRKLRSKPCDPTRMTKTSSTPTLQGGCACGKARFVIADWEIPNSMNHCYCHLCRRSSGAPFVSWVYASNFQWLTDEPPLVRTTSFGRRHICGTCAGVLTILYDEDAGEWVWPSAAALDDTSWRQLFQHNKETVRGCADGFLSRVAHIYCAVRPLWYKLPDDGLPRWDE